MANDDSSASSAGGQNDGSCALRCYRIGQTTFEKIAWPVDAFLAAWNETWPEPPATDASSDAALRDEYLRLACLRGAAGAVETLEDMYVQPLEATLTKRGSDKELVQETLQAVRHKLLLGDSPALASYTSTGHLRAWLQVVATRALQDLARQRGVRWSKQATLAEQLVSPDNGPDLRLQKSELDAIFVAALREVIQSLPQREKYALRMHVLAGWNVSQIGEAMSTHRATAARWIAAAKERINQNVRLKLKERLGLTKGELEQIFSLLSTHLDVRLSRVFETLPTPSLPNEDDALEPSEYS